MLRLGFHSIFPSPPLHADALHRCLLPSVEPRRRPGRRRVWRSGLGTVGRAPVRAVLSVGRPVEKDGRVEGRKQEYDAIVIGSGIGGLVAATQLAVKGARVLVLEKYLIPGGSAGCYERDGFTFDVGSSVMFGFGDKGNLNLITQALAAVGCKMQVIPDPTTIHFHLPGELSVRVHREYSEFIRELISKFPHEREGILKFYRECWRIFNALNSLELKSIEESIYLFGQFFRKPLECLTLGDHDVEWVEKRCLDGLMDFLIIFLKMLEM